MQTNNNKEIEEAKKAAIEVPLHNANSPFRGVPPTAGWSYPESYTRDLMFFMYGIVVTGNQELMDSIRNVLETLVKNQTKHGHIPPLVNDAEERSASDTTPLFLLGVGIFRKVTNEMDFLSEAVEKALRWMEYQIPSDRSLVAKQPTRDWRDEQWVTGYGLFVNTLKYSYLCLPDYCENADRLKQEMRKFTITSGNMHKHVHKGLIVKHNPYYVFWSYKVSSSEGFDLLRNKLAILTGLTSPTRANKMVPWMEEECNNIPKNVELTVDLPPNFFTYIESSDSYWQERSTKYNKPGEHHNGGICPFICGLYITALVVAKRYSLAEKN